MRYVLLCLFCFSSLFSTGREKLLDVVAGQWIAEGVYTAAKLDLSGYLLNGSKSVEHLASLTNSDEDNLYRLLRMLASVGIFEEGPPHNFSNTSASALLAAKHPESLRSLVLFYSSEISQCFDKLDKCVRKGKPAFDLTFQKPIFEYFRDHPSSAKLFNVAMTEKSQLVVTSCLESYNFGKYATVYDIGGGGGHFLTGLLQKYPRMRGLLLETPEVIKEAKPKLEEFGQRCGMIAGDFFQTIPPDGKAYLLKSVLHDWDDENALKILRKCHATMRKDADLLIIEPLIAPANHKDYAKCMDVLMMAITGSKERSEADFRYLLRQAGFKIDSITRTETEFVIIQAKKS
ncbi:MAG: Multifunctional cyclase-dehydratase-3-O-methyl transferase TcmN [Chlamydiae bacterium]|nr:Multifunctional cyclase-dehydratase-3-O-methyl transferase TcmN [Chlamydiota bacterium]